PIRCRGIMAYKAHIKPARRASIKGRSARRSAYWLPSLLQTKPESSKQLHKVFGVSNVRKIIKSLSEEDRKRASRFPGVGGLLQT
ncbi:hypothetical protein Dimus_037119, partial [Dionaea muscipula]